MIGYDPRSWWSHLFDLRGSMVREITGRVLTCVAWAALVVSVVEIFDPTISIPAVPHSLVGVALGLLLVFRTNASYDRFWEARKLWGSIVNESRNLARSASVHLRDEPDLLAPIVRWTQAFAFASFHSLRGTRGLGPAGDRLPHAETALALAADHVPLFCARRITDLLRQARDRAAISDYVMTAIDQNTQILIDCLGGCERIHKTPLPYVYVVHLRRTLIVYCATLPIALVHDFHWWSILVTLLVTYLFFGIEEIGVEIEDPFGTSPNDLPLESIAQTIDRNLEAVLADVLGSEKGEQNDPLSATSSATTP